MEKPQLSKIGSKCVFSWSSNCGNCIWMRAASLNSTGTTKATTASKIPMKAVSQTNTNKLLGKPSPSHCCKRCTTGDST